MNNTKTGGYKMIDLIKYKLKNAIATIVRNVFFPDLRQHWVYDALFSYNSIEQLIKMQSKINRRIK